MIEIGTLVAISDLFNNCDDLGIVLGHWDDPADGTHYLKVRWLEDWTFGKIEPCCVDVLS